VMLFSKRLHFPTLVFKPRFANSAGPKRRKY